MFKINWQSNFTVADRYETDGVIDRVFEYVRSTGKKNLAIMDVGCSSAIAVKYLRFILEGKGIGITKIIGVDPSENIRIEAEENLDEFIPLDILDVKDEPGKADIMICCKMILWVQPQHRVNVLLKCSKFLKDDGGLITDADKYEEEKDVREFILWCKDYWKSIYSFRKGLVSFFRAIKETEKMRHKREMFLVIGRENVNSYALEVLQGWNKRSIYKKFQIHHRNFHKRMAAHFQKRPRKKKRRKQSLM